MVWLCRSWICSAVVGLVVSSAVGSDRGFRSVEAEVSHQPNGTGQRCEIVGAPRCAADEDQVVDAPGVQPLTAPSQVVAGLVGTQPRAQRRLYGSCTTDVIAVALENVELVPHRLTVVRYVEQVARVGIPCHQPQRLAFARAADQNARPPGGTRAVERVRELVVPANER